MKSPHNSLDDLRRRLTIEPETRSGAFRRQIGMVYKPPQNRTVNILEHDVTALGALESTHANLR
eukprot:9200179-Pyramimonas_sp.AAC.1